MKIFLAISLITLLLVGNIGFTIGTHLCCGQAVNSELMIGHNHLADNDCPKKGKHVQIKGCCEDHYQTIVIEDELKSAPVQVSSFEFALAFVHTFLNIALFSDTEKPQYSHYSPPLLLRDMPVLNQVFII
ncbi:MAG: hypothetical protein KY428_12795 [Bacteroidetes bacterium]|nr:hypothetical protein [Bacteroidota bacterium]